MNVPLRKTFVIDKAEHMQRMQPMDKKSENLKL